MGRPLPPQVSLADIERASSRTRGHLRRTPVLQAGSDVWFKLEFMQHSGSFKARGAFNRLLAAAEAGTLPAAGIVAASGGNAGLAFAHAARELAVPATIFVPTISAPVKVNRLRELGATVVQEGSEYAAAHEAALAAAAASGALYCHAYDQPEVVAGQGIIGLELLEQIQDLDTVLVAVGGGGLMAGIAVALGNRARVIAVEPEAAPTLHAALAAGAPTDVTVGGVAADALGARRIGDIAFGIASGMGIRSLLVPDEAIAAARRELWQRYRLVTEPAGAAAWALLASGAWRPAPDERVAVLLCGANTDPADL